MYLYTYNLFIVSEDEHCCDYTFFLHYKFFHVYVWFTQLCVVPVFDIFLMNTLFKMYFLQRFLLSVVPNVSSGSDIDPSIFFLLLLSFSVYSHIDRIIIFSKIPKSICMNPNSSPHSHHEPTLPIPQAILPNIALNRRKVVSPQASQDPPPVHSHAKRILARESAQHTIVRP